MSQPLYIFDMDDTLVDGDCAMLWNIFLVEKKIIVDPDFLETDRAIMSQYAKGSMNMEDYLTFALQPITTLPTNEVDKLVDEFVTTTVLPRVFPEALALIQRLKAEKATLLVISATVTFIVQKVANKLGIEQAIGIDLLKEGDAYSNKVSGIASYREGKVKRLKSWISENNHQFDDVHFYTDSINDLPLCLYADHVYLINPCAQLSEQAKNHNDWQIYQWER
jgi:HAD superfamily hydrolase (TIGR01490 family)